MHISDPKAGRACIWLVSGILFVAVIVGGVCLIMYKSRQDTESQPWLPVAGITLVSLPWAFWTLTFIYRVVSYACGPRSEGANGGSNARVISAGDGMNATHTSKDVVDEAANMESGLVSQGNQGKEVHFQDPVVVTEQHDKKETSSRPSALSMGSD